MAKGSSNNTARSAARRWLQAAAALAGAMTVCPPLTAQTAPPENMEAQAGNLRIVHVWTTDAKSFRAAFGQPSLPALQAHTTAERNQPIHLMILYANCQRDPDDKCWLTAQVRITAPDGTPYGKPAKFNALPMGPGTPQGRLGLAPGSMALIVENGEQLGRYKVQLAVTDEIAVQTAVSVIYLDIVEAKTPAK
jgi:hypothetical protein